MQSPSVCPSAPPIALTDVVSATRLSETQLLPPPTIVYLRPLVFRLCWIGMLALHAGLAVYYIALAKLHQCLRDPLKNPHKYVFYFLGPQYPPFLVVVVAGAIILAVCHLLAIVSMLTHSLRGKDMRFSTSTRVIKPRSGSKLNTPVTDPQRLLAIVQGWLEIVIGRYGWLGIDYHHARLVFVCRELFEISCQIVQANRLSHLVSVVWINRLFALAVVGNCWSSPLIRLVCQRLYRFPHQDRQRIALEKVLEILSDGLLSIVYATIIPYAIFQSYYRQFDHKTQTFGLANYYSDDWFIKATISLRQAFVGSWFDLLCLLGPGVATLSALSTVKLCLCSLSPRTIRPTLQNLGPSFTSYVGSSPHSSDVYRSLSSFAKLGPRHTRFLVSLLNALLGLLGLGVLICHLHATSVALSSSDSGCLLELRPWGKAAYTCVTLEVSCSQKQIQGEQDKINHLLKGMDPLGVQSLVFSHCPRLEIPSRLLSLTKLTRLKIFNSSVAVWDASAAISGTTNPLLGIVSFIETNLSTIPEGILHPNVPSILSDIVLSGTNLTQVPDTMHTMWSRIKFFSLEASPMVKAIPPSVGLIKTLIGVNFIGNDIRVIPDQLFANNSMRQIILDGIPLTSLPPTFGSPLLLDAVRVQHTDVAQIPVEWFTLYSKPNMFGNWLALSAGDTPLCFALQRGEYASIVTKSGNATVAQVSDVIFRVANFPVDCTSSPKHRQYPLQDELKWREKNRH